MAAVLSLGCVWTKLGDTIRCLPDGEPLKPRSTGLPKVEPRPTCLVDLASQLYWQIDLGFTSRSPVDLGSRDFSGHGWYGKRSIGLCVCVCV